MLVSNRQSYDAWWNAARRLRRKDDGFAVATLIFADKWAEAMEPRIAAGENIATMADELRRELLPGEMSEVFSSHTSMADFVSDYYEGCWVHGQAFRRWYGATRTSAKWWQAIVPRRWLQ